MSITFDSIYIYMVVFARFGGLIFLNPLLSRKNVPTNLRVGFVLCLTILIAPLTASSQLANIDSIGLVMALFRELFVGLCCSYVFMMFFYLLFFAGDIMDFQFGLSMAKAFDPGSQIQASISGNLLSILFVLYLFATDSHLLMIRIFAASFDVIPAGAQGIMLQAAASFALKVFISAFSLAVRLAIPFIAAEFILELAMGVLMKLIPQIHVFVINVQFKVLLGIFMLMAFAQPIAGFIDNYTNILFETMNKALYALM